jgi:hypothetical protein
MREKLIHTPVRRNDDLAAYRANDTPEEQHEAVIASLAHDVVYLHDRAKRERGSRVIVTIAIPWYDLGIERLQIYLRELGVNATITEQRLESGRYLQIAPIPRQRGHPPLQAVRA